MLKEKAWKTIYEEFVPDVEQTIKETTKDGNCKIYIGTDSQKFDKKIDFVTAIVIRNELNRGTRVFYAREKNPRFNSLREKLVKEAWLSIQVALEVEQIIPKSCTMELHADVNSDFRFASSKYCKEIIGMVSAQNFAVLAKPNAWAASRVAEHIVKHRNEKPEWLKRREHSPRKG